MDNRTNIRYEGFHKPYFATAADGSLVLGWTDAIRISLGSRL
jgi:hypothetical protein